MGQNAKSQEGFLRHFCGKFWVKGRDETQQWAFHPSSSWGSSHLRGFLKKGTSLSNLEMGGVQTYCLDWVEAEDSVKQQSSQTQGREVKCPWGREGHQKSPEVQVINSILSPVLSRNSSSQDSSGVLTQGLAFLQGTERTSQAEIRW